MSLFTQHTVESAPQGASEVLAKVVERYGFIPNLAAFVAESPVTLDAIMGLSGQFDNTSLRKQEQQIVLMTVSSMNGCDYCKTVHSALGRMAEVDAAIIRNTLALEPLADAKLEALRKFTQQLVEKQGYADDAEIEAFLDAGYSRSQVFEVVMGIALKTLTNFSNHLAGAVPNPQFIEMAQAA